MAIAVETAAVGGEIVWGAPTYDQVYTGWEETYKAARNVAKFHLSRMMAIFPGGGRITYRSLDDPDNARSKTADGIVIDEAGDVVEAAWYEVLRPMLMDTGGWLLAGGTPKGRNWFWREFMAAADRPDSRAWNAPTLGVRITDAGLIREPHPLENPEIPFAEIEHLYRTLPERVFRQEVLAEFIEESGGVFRGVEACVDAGRTFADPPNSHQVFVCGVDLARTHDFTVLTILDGTGRQVYHERFNQIAWERQIGAIVNAAARYRAHVVIDSTGVGEPIYDRVQAAGIPATPFHFSPASKGPLIDSLAMRIEQGGIRLMDVPQQTAELLAYQYELTAYRNIRMNAPQGFFDDCVIALALACYGLGQSGGIPAASAGRSPIATHVPGWPAANGISNGNAVSGRGWR